MSEQMTDHDRALDCLAHLAPWRAEDRENHYKVGMALKSVSDELYGAWLSWSRQAPNHCDRYCKNNWRGFKAGGGVTLGTLIHMARQDGHEISNGQAGERLAELRKARATAPDEAVRVDRNWAALVAEAWSCEGLRVDVLAEQLGLTVGSLQRLGLGWFDRQRLEQLDTPCRSDGAWTFPMTNPLGQSSGIRLRTPDGFKYSVNSSDGVGLFVPSEIAGGTSPLFVIEGPTDTGAILDLGEDCIGRPNNMAGNDQVRQWISLNRPQTREVVIVIDRDKADSDLAWKMLGRAVGERMSEDAMRRLFEDAGLNDAERGTTRAAVKLARRLARAGRKVTISIPPVGQKDARDWLKAGASNDELWMQVDAGVKLAGRLYGWMRRSA